MAFFGESALRSGLDQCTIERHVAVLPQPSLTPRNSREAEQELKLIASHDIKIHHLDEIVHALSKDRFAIGSASGADIVDLILMGSRTPANE